MDRTSRQKEGIKKWLQNKGVGIFCYCTGFGKNFTAILAIKSVVKHYPDSNILISVPSEVLKLQWQEKIDEANLSQYCTIEIINSIVKKKWNVTFLIIDEIHRTPTTTFIQIFNQVEYDFILGLTGTIKRLDGKEVLIKNICPIVDTVTVDEAVENKWLSPYKEYKVLVDVDLTEYNELSRKFNNYFSYFNYDFKVAMKCVTDYKYRNKYAYSLKMSNSDMMAITFDWMRCMHARKKFVMSHPKKLDITHNILENRTDKKCITFSATIKDAEKIKYGKVLHSKQTKKKSRTTMEEFNKQQSGVLNTSKSVDEGADIAGVSVGIILSGDSSSIKKNQRRGRFIRYEEGKVAEIFTLVLKGTMEESWYHNSSKSNYTTINEQELELILQGKEITTRKRNDHENLNYRF